MDYKKVNAIAVRLMMDNCIDTYNNENIYDLCFRDGEGCCHEKLIIHPDIAKEIIDVCLEISKCYSYGNNFTDIPDEIRELLPKHSIIDYPKFEDFAENVFTNCCWKCKQMTDFIDALIDVASKNELTKREYDFLADRLKKTIICEFVKKREMYYTSDNEAEYGLIKSVLSVLRYLPEQKEKLERYYNSKVNYNKKENKSDINNNSGIIELAGVGQNKQNNLSQKEIKIQLSDKEFDYVAKEAKQLQKTPEETIYTLISRTIERELNADDILIDKINAIIKRPRMYFDNDANSNDLRIYLTGLSHGFYNSIFNKTIEISIDSKIYDAYIKSLNADNTFDKMITILEEELNKTNKEN